MRKLLSTLCVFLFLGCFDDRFSPITITNTTSDTLIIQVKENSKFSTQKVRMFDTADGLSVYKLKPHEVLQCGNAINNIDDDVPFSSIIVVCKDDTLVNNQGNALVLFDKTPFGSLAKPYNVSLKKL